MSKQNESTDTIEDELSSAIEEISGSVIKVRTMKGIKTFDIGKLFNVDKDNLSNEFTTQASLYGFFAILAADADRIAAMKGLLYDQEAAAADEGYRAQLELDGKKFTEAVIKSMVVRDENALKALEAKENADYELAVLKAIVRAFEQRAMMLQSLGSQLRHEYDMQGMNIREQSADKIGKDVKIAIESRRKLRKSDE